MTAYALVPYVGTGSLTDPFQPVGHDQAGWAAIDLRPDGSRRDGWSLAALSADAGSGVVLGDDLDAPLPPAIRRAIENRLSVNISAKSLRRVLPELLVDHARTDGTRWLPLQPRKRKWSIHLGGEEVWNVPVVAGGAIYREFFGGTGLDMGADLTWTEGGGGLERVGDDLRCSTGSVTTCYGRAEHDANSSDTRTFIDIVTWAGSTVKDVQAVGRMSSSSFDGYVSQYNYSSTGSKMLFCRKWVSGAWTNLASPVSVTSVLNPNMRVQVECEGSTIRGYLGRTTGSEVYDDPTLYFTVTDTSIPTGTRGGVIMHAGTVTDVEADNFFHLDLRLLRPTVGYIGLG